MGLIRASDYFKHTGQYQTMTLDGFAQPTIASTAAISCYVYTEEDKRIVATDERVEHLRIIGLLPITVTVAVNDRLVSVIDASGNSVLASGRITSVAQQNPWWEGLQFHQVYLEVN